MVGVLVRGGAGGGVLNYPLPDLLDTLLVRLVGVKTVELVDNFRSSLQPHGDLLISTHTDMLDVFRDGVGGLRAEIGDEGDGDDDASQNKPSIATATTSTKSFF